VQLGDGASLATWRIEAVGASAEPVVLLHGGPGLWDYLEPIGGLLGDGRTIYWYDQRGCGRSSASDEQSMARSVRDLEELRAHWGVDRLVPVGHSFGATLALAYAGTHPDRTAGVAYVCGVGIGDWRTPFRAELIRRQAPYAERLTELTGKARSWEEEAEWRRLTWASDYADRDRGFELARPMAETRLPINYDANSRITFTDDDVLRWAAATTCPVMVVHGDADPRPAANAVALASHLQKAKVRIIAGAGHLPWVERPGETVAALLDLLEL